MVVLTLAALWGGTPVAICYSVDALPPVAVAAVRFTLAAFFMLFWCRWEGTPLRLNSGQLVPVLVAGVLLFVQISLFHIGVHLSNSAHSSLLINTFVFWVAAIDHFVTKSDRLTLWRFLGLLIAAMGVILVLTETAETSAVPVEIAAQSDDNTQRLPLSSAVVDPATLVGDLLLVVSGLLLGVKIAYTKHVLKSIEPGKLVFWHNLVGVALFAAYSASFERFTAGRFSGPAIAGLLYQGLLVAGLCFAVYTRLLKHHSASRLAIFSFATPLFGVAIAFVFRGDPLSSWLFVSGICVACGILMVNAPPPAVLLRCRPNGR